MVFDALPSAEWKAALPTIAPSPTRILGLFIALVGILMVGALPDQFLPDMWTQAQLFPGAFLGHAEYISRNYLPGGKPTGSTADEDERGGGTAPPPGAAAPLPGLAAIEAAIEKFEGSAVKKSASAQSCAGGGITEETRLIR